MDSFVYSGGNNLWQNYTFGNQNMRFLLEYCSRSMHQNGCPISFLRHGKWILPMWLCNLLMHQKFIMLCYILQIYIFRYIYLILAMGALLFLISCLGCVGIVARSPCCLCFVSSTIWECSSIIFHRQFQYVHISFSDFWLSESINSLRIIISILFSWLSWSWHNY